jgi:TP901 family phage tail tape measure protein
VASIGDIFLRLLLDDSDFEANVVKRATKAGDKAGQSMSAAMGKALTSFGNDAMKVGKSMTKVGDSMTRNVTVPILAAGAATGKLALDFDTTMNQIVGLAKVPRDQIAGVRDEILKMAGDVGRSPQELAEAFYFVASAGFSADEAMKVLDISAKAAASGMGETQDIAKVLGGVINAYGHENLDAATAADQLTAAIQDGSAEASDFAGVIGTLAPGAAALGVSFDQVTAALAGMTNVGLSADEAATSLNQVFSGLLKPTSQAEEAMKGLGLSSAGLRQEL